MPVSEFSYFFIRFNLFLKSSKVFLLLTGAYFLSYAAADWQKT